MLEFSVHQSIVIPRLKLALDPQVSVESATIGEETFTQCEFVKGIRKRRVLAFETGTRQTKVLRRHDAGIAVINWKTFPIDKEMSELCGKTRPSGTPRVYGIGFDCCEFFDEFDACVPQIFADEHFGKVLGHSHKHPLVREVQTVDKRYLNECL